MTNQTEPTIEQLLDRYDEYKERSDNEAQYPGDENYEDIKMAFTRLMDKREIEGQIKEAMYHVEFYSHWRDSDAGKRVTELEQQLKSLNSNEESVSPHD